jgi:hypothetical protein
MQWVRLSLLVGALAGCETTATEREKRQALQTYIGCLRQRAAEVDDGKMSVDSLAAAIRPACTAAFQGSLEVAARGLSPDAKQTFFAQLSNEERRESTAVASQQRERFAAAHPP